MLNPSSEITKIREKAINDKSFKRYPMTKRIHNVTEGYYGFRDGLKDKYSDIKIEIKFYDSMPPVYFCMCSNYAVVGWYWHSVRTTQTQMIEIEGEDSELLHRLKKEFNHIWELESTKTAENIFPDIFEDKN